MLRPDQPADDPSDGIRDGEARVRADERSAVEQELRTLEEDRRAREGYVVADGERLDRDDRMSEEPIEVVRTRSFSFGQLLTMLVGAGLVALGIAALVATGVDTPLDQPVEEVLGWNHAPLLGIAEIVAGALLVLFSLRPGGRWFVAVIGVALVLGGVMILGELDWTVEELGAEQGFAWVPIVGGLVALLSSMLTPRRYQRMTGIPVAR